MAPVDRPGAVIAARLSILAAECADPERFSRGKRAAREGAVVEFDVATGEVSAAVQGSERTPYEVRLGWRPTQFRPGVVPARDELILRCTCADMAPVCKHAVAVLVHFAERVATTPALLYHWRGEDERWEHLPVRPALHSVGEPDRSPSTGPRLRPGQDPENIPEQNPLEDFFGRRTELWTNWQADDLDPFPQITALQGEPRPPAGTQVTGEAAALLDETMDALTSVYS